MRRRRPPVAPAPAAAPSRPRDTTTPVHPTARQTRDRDDGDDLRDGDSRCPEPPPPPPLETTSDTTALTEQTTALIANANRDLGRVDFVALSVEAKAQYQRASGFVVQAQSGAQGKEPDLRAQHGREGRGAREPAAEGAR